MKKTIIGMLAGLVALSGVAQDSKPVLNGAGASFPAPVYRIWTYQYTEESGVRVNYQSLGSGAGINQIKAGTIAFGGTDNPLTKEDLDQSGLIQFPMLMGGVVVIANVPGINANDLKLNQEVLSKIFLGEITSWDDAQIKALNPTLALPKLNVTVVARSDSSGTTFIFTDYLTKISKDWESKVGRGPAVKWPVGIRAQKNPGVCTAVQKTRGAIGYTEYTYAIETNLPMPQLRNKDGKFLAPTSDAFKAAGANADWENAPGFYMMLTEQPGEKSWPIAGLTYVLLHRNQSNEALGKALLGYINWCFDKGGDSATKMHYVPMPENVVKMIRKEFENITFGKVEK
jgi:phosphate transport system substrate-binding protein